MAGQNMNLETLLGVLDLEDFYPEKVTRDMLYQITDKNLDRNEKDPEKIAWQFIRKIVHFNYNARNVQNDEVSKKSTGGYREKARQQKIKLKASVHPLDIVVAVFFCCEPTARQDIVTHLWGCKLAVPFILPLSCDGEERLSAFVWPLRGLGGFFCVDGEFHEKAIVDQPFDCIGFLKVGDVQEWSKSKLLDCLIWGSEKTHPSFFHRECRGSKKFKSDLVNGLVEICWFLPSEEANTYVETFQKPIMFANLRGNAIDHSEQVKVIGKMSTLTIVLTDLDNFERCMHIVQSLSAVNSSSLIILTNEESDDLGATIEKSLGNFEDDAVEVLPIGGMMLPDILESLHVNIKRMISANKENDKVILSNLESLFADLNCSIDETGNDYKEAFKIVNKMIQATEGIPENDRKISLFPLQELFWKKWAEKDRDYWRYDQMDEKEKTDYINQKHIEDTMKRIRSDQFSYLKEHKLAVPMKLFLQALSSFESFEPSGISRERKERVRRIFMRYLKLYFSNISKRQVSHLDKKYHDMFVKMSSASLPAEQKKSLKVTLSKIENEKSKISFGFENIFREMGQIYEACETTGLTDEDIPFKDDDVIHISHTMLPKYACHILQDGYPIEILDGDACSVPLLWIKQIFLEFPHIFSPMKEPKLHVISVLGIQSSGKSTFINTAFGLQFPVSAGRCTRGAFMQVIKVHPSAYDHLNADVDFIIVVDTEGLKSVLLSPTESVKHDNELSTFAIGLAHTTVINLMSENATYLRENLPIVVHAFLRMFMVNLHRRCSIVHHNMDKSNRSKLLEQELSLQTILDELTRRACELEKIPVLLFTEIIKFDIQKHTSFIPGLLEGKLPMAPISASYSRETEATKNTLLKFIPEDKDKGCTESPMDFAERLKQLWTAIKKDRFVYEFRTTSEICNKMEVDGDYLKVLRKVLHDMQGETNKWLKYLMSCESADDGPEVINNFKHFIAKREKYYIEKLQHKFDKRKKSGHFSTDWNTTYIRNFRNEIESSMNAFEDQVESCIRLKNIRSCMFKGENYEILRIIMKKNSNNFNKSWKDWLKVLKFDTCSYEDDAIKALKSICPLHQQLIKKEAVKASPLLKHFQVDEYSHTNCVFRRIKREEILDLKRKMFHIRDIIADKVDSQIRDIYSKEVSYSEGLFKHILITTEYELNEQLTKEDKNMDISNQFRIDLLLSVAKTCSNKLNNFYTESKEIKCLKKEMYDFMLLQYTHETKASGIILNVVHLSIFHHFRYDLPCFVIDAAERSVIRKKIMSKVNVMRYLIEDIISNQNDELLNQYILSPTHAFQQFYLDTFKRYVSHEFIENDLQFYIRLGVDRVTKAFENVWRREREFENLINNRKDSDKSEENAEINTGDMVEDIESAVYEGVTLGKLVDIIVKETDIPFEVKSVAKKELLTNEAMGDQYVNIGMLKEQLLESIESFIDNEVQRLEPIIKKEVTDVSETCAENAFVRTIGCRQCCAKCNELCILSARHSGDHVYIFHRPVENASDIYHIDISCVWKWLAYQNFEQCRYALKLSTKREEWRLISKGDVINEIRNIFQRSED